MITKADLFVTQSLLSLHDPDGPYTAGKPAEIVDWLADQIVAANRIPKSTNLPLHIAVELDDGSSITVVPGQDEMRIAPSRRLSGTPEWSAESDAWFHVGDQAGAIRYQQALFHTMEAAPHPAQVIQDPRGQKCEEWLDTMMESLHGKLGHQANEAARRAWKEMQKRG